MSELPRVDWRHVLRRNWRNRFVLLSMSDLDRPRTAAELEDEEQRESEYRRGYLHGYSQAMDDMLRVSKQEYSRVRECWNWLAQFFDGPLHRWAHKSRPEYSEPPRLATPPKWSEQRAAVKKRDARCVSCGSTHSLECDHIVPVLDGGRAELDNLRMLCAVCHRERARGRNA